jgi:hypothetical protein
LVLKKGVNLLVGEKNTGKTVWLRMLDYLMGDDSQPQEAFGNDVAAKYDSISATLEIAAEQIILERRWKESGARTKVFVNGEAISAGDFSQYLLKRLNIPVTHFPKGSPFAERAWPDRRNPLDELARRLQTSSPQRRSPLDRPRPQLAPQVVHHFVHPCPLLRSAVEQIPLHPGLHQIRSANPNQPDAFALDPLGHQQLPSDLIEHHLVLGRLRQGSTAGQGREIGIP